MKNNEKIYIHMQIIHYTIFEDFDNEFVTEGGRQVTIVIVIVRNSNCEKPCYKLELVDTTN